MFLKVAAFILSIFIAWKLHLIHNSKVPPPDILDLSTIDQNQFNTSATFRNVDVDCRLNLVPDGSDDEVYIGFLVHTAPKHFKQRARYRSMDWKPKNLGANRGSIKLIFVLGTVQDPQLQGEIEAEHAEHGDILQTDISDGYRYLTYKTIAGLLWMHQNFKSPKYLGKLDDDLTFDLESLVEILDEIEEAGPVPNTVYCTAPYANFKPLRRRDVYDGKFYMSEEEYPHPVFPQYCNGWIYLLESDFAWRLTLASSVTKFNFLEDLYVPGLLRERIEGSRIEVLAKGNLYRKIMTYTLSHCSFLSWYNYVLNQEVVIQMKTDYPRLLICPIFLGLSIDINFCAKKT